MPVEAREIVTPLILQAWERGLEQHPDRWWAEYLVGIREGCHLEFSRESCELRSNSRNMVSDGEQPKVVREYLDKEVAEKRVWVVGATGEVAQIQCSPFGVIPKKGKPADGS